MYIQNLDAIKNQFEQDLLNNSDNVVGIDIESTGLDPHVNITRLIQICINKNVYIFDMFYVKHLNKYFDEIKFTYGKIFVGHNLKFDIQFLWKLGIDLSNSQLFDTMITEQVLTNGKIGIKFDLKSVMLKYTRNELDKDEQLSDWSAVELTESQKKYAQYDCQHLPQLREKMLDRIKREKEINPGIIKILKLEFDYIPVIATMEYNGVYLNKDKWLELLPKYETIAKQNFDLIESNLYNMYTYVDFAGNKISSTSISSSSQLLRKLQELGIHTNSTNDKELKKLDTDKYPILNYINGYRKSKKIITSYLLNFPLLINPVTNRLHANLFQLGTKTARLAAHNPAIMTIPRTDEFRQCFEGQDGNKLFDADYSQIEARLSALAANEPRLLKIFEDDLDVYSAVAAMEQGVSIEEFNKLPNKKSLRQDAKSMVLGLCFGMGSVRYRDYCQESWGINRTLAEAKKTREKFFMLFPELVKWHERCQMAWEDYGFSPEGEIIKCLRNKNGRPYYQTMIKNNPDSLQYSFAINFPIQSLAADIAKQGQILVFNYLKQYYGRVPLMGSTPIFQILFIHDEMLMEGDEDSLKLHKDKISELMVQAAITMTDNKVKFNADGGIGDNWSSAKG